MLFSVAFAYLAVWLPRDVLPDNARYLWRKAHITWSVHEKMASRDKDSRALSEIDYDLRECLRDLATTCIPSVQDRIVYFNKFVEDNKHSADPVVQADVEWHRKHLTKCESSLRWYKKLLELPDHGPILMPAR